MESVVSIAFSGERLLALLAGVFGGLALLLSIIGLYGLLAYDVAPGPEIGLRMALGAQRRVVIAMVLRRSVGLVLLGTALGMPAAFVASRIVWDRI
jgi:ABC-type antimicrobial peptide transport system permease subunit